MLNNRNLNFPVAEINLVLHATEDSEKVLRAIREVLEVGTDCFQSAFSEGHHKNRILFLKAFLSSHEAARLASRIVSLLNRDEREHLLRSIHEYSDEKGNLYLRLDKQKLCHGVVSISETDAIRIKFKHDKRFYKPSTDTESLRYLFESDLSN
jgi:RNA binding exosome subunit